MPDLRWTDPDALWLLWILPPLALLAVLAHRGTRRAAQRFAEPRMAARILPRLSAGGPALRALLFLGGIGAGIVALARPAWDVYFVATTAQGVDVVVALDVSRSMLADDGGEPRLERGRAAVQSL